MLAMPAARPRRRPVVRRSLAWACLASACLAATACAPPSTLTGATGRNVLSLREVPASYRTFTLLDMLRDIRPEFLQNRARTTRVGGPTEPVVYVNGLRLMELDMLRHVATRSLVEVRYVRGVDAVARYGLDHEAGVLLVTAKTGP
jgi:hypothetical protein